ncbi:MAG: diguanylate cyclase, partial [Clostridia bacterium]|nr:diguanylate cyclase [Clostridia bacterium]
YIVGSCSQICEVYAHSPVFRIGGDEFAILLRGADYDNRAALYNKLNRRFTDSRTDTSRQPWDRYSAASGMAVFGSEGGETVDEVFRTADERMYEDKQHMKKQGYL